MLSTPPVAKVGWYADLFRSKSDGWKLIHVSAYESPRVSRDWIAEMEQDFGADSPVYQSKVLGEIPDASSSTVIPVSWIERAQGKPAVENKKPAVITCDVAREGEDLTVVGMIHRGKLRILEWKAKNDTMEAAGMCLRAATENHATVLAVDDTGVGGGVVDRLRELQREGKLPRSCYVRAVRFGQQASRKDRFHTEKDELWWETREALRDGSLALPTDEELAALRLPRGSNFKAQLATPIYEEDSQSRIRVLDKRTDNREKTRALPTKSPDLAHALIIGVKWWKRLQPDTSLPMPTTTAELVRREREEAWAAREALPARGPLARRMLYRKVGRRW